MEFDLHAQKTEVEWSRAYHAFWKSITEGAFRVLGWSTATAALKVLADRSGSNWLHGASYVAHALILGYLSSLFTNGLYIRVFKEVPLPPWKLAVTIIVNLTIIAPVYWGLTTTSAATIDAVSKLGPITSMAPLK